MRTSPWLKVDSQHQTVGRDGLTTVTVHGIAALQEVRTEIADLAARCELPTTASADWIFATIAVDPSAQPWAVLVRDEHGILRSSIVLASTGEGQVRIVGTDQGNRGAIAADSAAAVEALAEGVLRSLRDRPPGEIVVLGPVDANHPHTQMFGAALPGSTLLEDDPIPLIRNEGLALTEYLSNGMRRQLRKARNRLETDELVWAVSVTTDPAEIRSQLPVLERCHRERDHAHGRASALDNEEGLRLWRARIESLSRAGDLELATLSINDEFAAHTLSIFDGNVYRVLEGRFISKWSRYSPGRLLEAHIVDRVLKDQSIQVVDWMTATAPEKLLATNDSDAMVYVHVL